MSLNLKRLQTCLKACTGRETPTSCLLEAWFDLPLIRSDVVFPGSKLLSRKEAFIFLHAFEIWRPQV